MKELMKIFGGGAVALLSILAVVLIPVLLIQGGVRLAALLYPWLIAVNGLALAVTVFLFLPNAVFSSTPKFAGSGMMIASYVFGAPLWVWSLLLTYALWGGLGLFIGLFMAGVGVVPLAMLATLINAMWSELGQLASLLILAFGVRVWGYGLLQKALRNA